MKSGGTRVLGVSRLTGLPRFVVRVRAKGGTYHYFRHGPHRERLPDPTCPQFAGSYAAVLARHGLIGAAKGSAPVPNFKEPEVYFIKDEHTGAIKIGTAQYPRQRLKELQVGSSAPLRLLATVPGGRDLEKQLHNELRRVRIRGEWFLNASDVTDRMKALVAANRGRARDR